MRLRQACVCAVLLLTMISSRPVAEAQNGGNPELAKTLAQIDAVSAKFSSFSAKFTQKKYLTLLKEFETPESGEFYYALDKKQSEQSVQMRHEVQVPARRITTIKGDSAVVYQPATKQAQSYSLGKRKNLVEYLATGLGQSSAKLREQFQISYEGTETVGGAPCAVLALVPKNQSAAASVKSITIWFKKSTGTPTQYKFLEPTGDYMLETFSDDKLNAKIPAD
ncbi:MAG: outer membrane lipoprotein carrier protein LolA, partial [Acidobacteriota bacterium]|nr:outer membrane lipoprotein carrier protein LolA [Acidobacteriota bacterium]